MTPEEQRIAIAQASQGTIEFYEDVWYYFDGKRLQPCKDNDPLQDLNAMHEAEKVLINKGNWAMCDYDQELHIMTSSWKWNATAAKRAEAFLRTLNLWKP